MQWFHDLKLKTRLLTAFGSIVLLGVLLGGFSLWQLAVVNSKSTEIAENWLPSVESIEAMWARTAEVRSAQFQHVTSLTDADMSEAESHMAERIAEFEKARDGYRKLISSPEEKALSDDFDRKWTAYMAQWEQTRLLSRENRNAEASSALRGDGARLYAEMSTTLMSLVKLNHDGGAKASTEGDAAYARSEAIIAIVALISVLAGIVIALSTANRLTSVVASLSRTAESVQANCISSSMRAIAALARGDTTVKAHAGTPMIRSSAKDELGDLARTFDLMIENMGSMVVTFNSTQDKVEALVTDAAAIADAARAGQLEVRADAARYEGSFRLLVDGLNGTMDAVAAPIDESEQVLGRVAARDLGVRMTGDYRGKYLAIKTAVNTAVENLDGTLLQVDAAAEQVASAGTEITTASQSLANGASEQAASLEEVSASVHMFASMAQQSASNANEARSLAASARNDTTEGTARMQRLTEAVAEIRKSSADTAKIIKTIDEIAFQTNLLALNAAVEAARAGDAGRGFAVVAEEVRALALRAAEAAKTTATLIEQGQVSADRGVALNGEVMESLTRINTQIEKVALVTAEISAATEQQVEGVDQIKTAVDQINTVTQQVAANAEESASAATELDSQAQTLRETVSAFTLSRAATPSVAHTYNRPSTVGAGRPAARASRAAPPPPARRATVTSGSTAKAAAAIPFDDDDEGVLDSF